jgi:4-amino-4-deoxy-L-arabinose transferase-like glycosyltransferase
LLNLLLTSAVVPAAWLAARRVFPGSGYGLPLAIAAAAALFPELMFDGARISNSALSIALYSALAVLCLAVVDGSRRAAPWMGVTVGLGLLTKGFFLTAVPLMIVLLVWAMWKCGLPRRFAASSMALAAATPGWWYLHNLRTTGGFSTAIQDAALKHMPMSERLRHVVDVNWFTAIDSTFFSHIWFGGWSFLQVRAWIYHVFAALAVLAIVGLVLALRRGNPERRYIVVLAALYVLFCSGIAYHVLLTYLANGISSSAGWYLCAVLVPETVLLAAGLRVFTRWAVAGLAAAFALLDLYGMLFVALPYYSGVIAHRPNGMLEAFHFSRLSEIGMDETLRRLAVNHPYGPVTIAVAGCLYVVATIALAVASVILQTAPLQVKRISAD